MSLDAAIALVFFVGWVGLAIALGFVYVWVRNMERDTRLEPEHGRTPSLEVIGKGRINRKQWSRGKACRVSLYEDFFVITAGSTRHWFPFYRIREVEIGPAPNYFTLSAHAEDETVVFFEFSGADAAGLAARFRERGRGGANAKVAGPA